MCCYLNVLFQGQRVKIPVKCKKRAQGVLQMTTFFAENCIKNTFTTISHGRCDTLLYQLWCYVITVLSAKAPALRMLPACDNVTRHTDIKQYHILYSNVSPLPSETVVIPIYKTVIAGSSGRAV